MTKQATLGPIDPSVNGPYNPAIPGITPPGSTLPVSVESVVGYFELAKAQIGEKADLNDVFFRLTDKVHPMALGNVHRSRTQIQNIARSILKYHIKDEKQIENIVTFLCSDSGSHDYTINRREARERLQLPIENPDSKLYAIIKNIYNDLKSELELNTPFYPELYLGNQDTREYRHVQALIESNPGGSHKFTSEGTLQRPRPAYPQGHGAQAFTIPHIVSIPSFIGWRHEDD